ETTVIQQAHELLREERVAACALEDRPLELTAEDGVRGERGDKLGGLRIGERSQVYRGRVPRPPRPARMLVVELGAGGAEQEQRHAFCPLGQVLEEGKQRLVCPVQVLEDEHGLADGGEALEEAPPCGEQLLPLRRRARLRPDQGSEPLQQPLALALLGSYRGLELRRGGLRRIGLEDPRLPLDDLTQRPKGDPLSVG